MNLKDKFGMNLGKSNPIFKGLVTKGNIYKCNPT